MTTLGKRLKQLRTAEGLSLRALAQKTTVTFSHLSDLESGRRMPSSSLIQELAIIYHKDVDELARLDERAVPALRQLIQKKPDVAAPISVLVRALATQRVTVDQVRELTES
jgi:transcriptional regulator with XRE-family HTH domain